MLGTRPVLDKRTLRSELRDFKFGGSQVPESMRGEGCCMRGEGMIAKAGCNPFSKIYIGGKPLNDKKGKM